MAAVLAGAWLPLGAAAQAEPPTTEGLGYLLDMSAASHAQVEIDELAAEKAEDEAVRAFAEALVDEHTERSAALAELAAEFGVEPVAALDPVSERRLEELRGLSGPAFDAEYVTGQVPVLYAQGWAHRRASRHVAEAPIREAAEAAIAPTEASYDEALELALEREDDLPEGLHPWDADAVVFGMNVDLAQIALGELMLDKSEDESVRAFAERMVGEHGQLLAAFTEQAGLHGIAPVEEPGPVELRLHEYLSGLSGWELDLEYMNAQVIFHDNWYKRIEFVGHNGREDAVRELAAAGHVGGMAHHDSAYEIVLGRRD